MVISKSTLAMSNENPSVGIGFKKNTIKNEISTSFRFSKFHPNPFRSFHPFRIP